MLINRLSVPGQTNHDEPAWKVPTMTSQTQVARLLAMVPYLQANQGVGVDDVAAKFGITKKQLLDDLKVLWMCGLPGGLPGDLIEIDMDAAADQGVIYLSNADYLARPARFTPDEAVSLLVALQAVAELATGSEQQVARSAAAKIAHVTGQQDLVLLAVSSGDDHIRQELASSIEHGRRIRLTYDGFARGETSYPVVDPVVLQMRDSVVYLQAWSVDRQAWRTYRVDRIAAVEATDSTAADHGAAPELPPGWFTSSDGEVTLELQPSATWIIDYYPVREADVHLDGSATVRLPVADPLWLESLLLRLGGAARVIHPPLAGTSAAVAAEEAIAQTQALFG